jgi:hypothetical protein
MHNKLFKKLSFLVHNPKKTLKNIQLIISELQIIFKKNCVKVLPIQIL